MKQIILLFTFLLISAELFPQITLTSSVNPAPGNLQNIIECDTTGVSQGNAGANQTWNFTGLVRQDSTLLTWVASSSTPYSAQFPTSNVASTIDNSNYNYFTGSSSSLLVNGNGGPSYVVSYTDLQTFITFPFTYNSSFTDNFAAFFNVGGFNVTRTGTTTVTSDAYGTINLPFGSFSDALRIKYVVSSKDSSNPGFPVVILSNITSYVWFVGGKKFPVCEIIYASSTFNGIPNPSTKHVSYSPNNPSLAITQTSTAVPQNYELGQNYPNPFNPVTNLEFEIPTLEFVSLKVYDMLGKEVATLINGNLGPGTYRYDFDASGLTSGNYFYKLETKDFSETKKMILLK